MDAFFWDRRPWTLVLRRPQGAKDQGRQASAADAPASASFGPLPGPRFRLFLARCYQNNRALWLGFSPNGEPGNPMGASNLGMNRVRTGSRGHDEQKLADFSAFLREGNVLALFHCVRPGHYIKSTSDA